MTDPREFIRDYVQPAYALWKKNLNVKHLAAHVIAQFDNLAEVLAEWVLLNGRAFVPAGEVGKFRKTLAAKFPCLENVKRAHDAHKHGLLEKKNREFAHGRRPISLMPLGHRNAGSPFGYPEPLPELAEIALITNEGSPMTVDRLVDETVQAWNQILAEYGISP